MAGPSNEPSDPESTPVDNATRHGLVISSTFPAFFLLAIFFVFRWVLIAGERADAFRDTAILFTLAGLILGAVNVVLRRRIADSES